MNELSPTWTRATRGIPITRSADSCRTRAGRNGGPGPDGRTSERAARPSRVAMRPRSATTASVLRPTQVRGERTALGIGIEWAGGFGKVSALRDRYRSRPVALASRPDAVRAKDVGDLGGEL